jgi:cation diffusion facilitator family transporter
LALAGTAVYIASDMSHGEGSKAVLVACIANGGIAVAKIVGFLMTGSASMLAEAVHSVADTGNQALLLLGSRRGARPASEAHPFGYGRERYFWSFIVAMVIFALGSVYAVYEGVHRIIHPEPLESPAIAIGILGLAVLLESWSFKTALAEARELRGDMRWIEFIRRTKAAELPVVLLEDVGALLGLVFALAGVSIALWTGDARFDAVGSIVIGILLGAISLLLSREMQSLLIGEAAEPEVEAKIRRALEGARDVKRVIHLRTVHLGPDELLVAAKLELSMTLSVPELCSRIDDAEAAVRAVVPEAKLLFLEPDVYRDEAAARDSRVP